MSIDLMAMLKEAIGEQAINQIGGMIGLDEPSTHKAFDGAAGTIFGGLMKKTKTQQGIDQIFGVTKENDGELLNNIGDLLSNADAVGDLQRNGGSFLDLVFGDQRVKAEGSVASSLGLSSGIVGKLMSLAGPMVMGVIGRYVKSKALNAAGLGSLLENQKSHLGNYVPPGLADNLGFGNFIDKGHNTAQTAASQASASKGGGLGKMLVSLGLLGAVGWGLYQFVLAPMLNGENPVDGIAKTMQDAGDAVGDGVAATGDAVANRTDSMGSTISGGIGDAMESVKIPGFDASQFNVGALGETGPKLTSGISEINAGFQKVMSEKNADAANGLAGTINGFTDSLGDLNIGEMAAPAKTAATGMLGSLTTTIESLMEKVPESLRAILQPAVEGLIEKINSITG